ALALRQMGTEARLAAEIAMNVDMDTLLDPRATRAGMQRTARELVERGAQTVILGCAGMAHHRGAVEDAAGVPVIEPCQAAAGVALSVLLAGAPPPHSRQGP
ncbi:MAG: aspartate/glutamate racemase family protein, partial [Elioraea tepidiphila]